MLLMVMGLVNPSSAFSQTQEDKLFEEPKRQESVKPDFTSKFARGLFWTTTVADMTTTLYTLNHPTVARRPDGSLLGTYHPQELSLPGNLLGSRNRFGIVALNVGQDLLVDRLAERMRRKGGKWGKVATGLLALQSANRIHAAFGNMKRNASVDKRMRAMADYPVGRIDWSNR